LKTDSKAEIPNRKARGNDPSLSNGVPQWSWVGLGRLAVLAMQLGLLLLLIRAFSLENANFFRVFFLSIVGFIVHALLPSRLRMPFFVILSMIGIAFLFGPVQGAWLVGLGMLLIGLAHFPVRFPIRIGLIIAVGGVLALLRSGAIKALWASGIWPILGAMFMFRMIVYLYDLKNRAAPFGFWRGMAYFFMLPNVCFTLFPVVDYKTFSRGYYRIDPFVTYQTGVNWIFRGLIQLILYRAAYQYLPADPSSINSSAGAALYFVRPYLLYLRISGSFHLIIGMLHLFGFNLPRTNFNYLLASSFTDYWRRVNIYWKDFLQKIIFNPLYVVFKRSVNGTTALILTTFIAFFATWALHSYQWFWIRNAFPVVWQDIVFWSLMGMFLLANMIYENRHGRVRSLGKPTRSIRSTLGLSLRTIGTFLVICTSWALWSAESFSELMIVLKRLARPTVGDVAWILAGLAGLGLAAIIYDRLERRGQPEVENAPRIRLFGVPIPFSALRVSFASAGLIFLLFGQLYFYYPPALANVLSQLKNPLFLNTRDEQKLTRGYYEDLTDVARFNPQLAELYKGRPAEWNRCWAIHRTGGFPTHEMLPSRRLAYKGAMMTTNRWGMRDRDYEKTKPKGTYRFALLGSSHSMGEGVSDDESFENVVEDRLNREISPRTGLRYEILNFSVGGYGPLSNLAILEQRVFDFQPDAVIHIGVNEFYFAVQEAIYSMTGVCTLPWPEPTEMARAGGVQVGMDFNAAMATLKPRREEFLLWAYRRMTDECKRKGVALFGTILPIPTESTADTKLGEQRQLALEREAGFTVIDMLDVYDSLPALDSIWVATWDRHPNAKGHRLLADRLYAGLVRELGLDK
jgi:D-alanyl-lipoteichoic acid acyltransferase DltB (MBOAT superfamily)